MQIDYIPGTILGILWTTASYSRTEKDIQLTNKDKSEVKKVRDFLAHFGFEYTIYGGSEIKRENKKNEYKYNYYRLKIYNRYLVHLLRNRYR